MSRVFPPIARLAGGVLAVAVAVASSLVACGERTASQAPAASPTPAPGAALPPGHPPIGGSAPTGGGFEVVPPPADAGSGETGLSWKTPAGWVAETPRSSMRKAQYRVPGPGGDAECVVFYFGPGQGGDARANAERWASQFEQPDGSSSVAAMKTSQRSVGGRKVMLVEVAGTYAGGMGTPMSSGAPQPGSMLLGAIAEGPDANWFFKLTGPQATVEANRAAFAGLVDSLS
jgi:hypothetical protein